MHQLNETSIRKLTKLDKSKNRSKTALLFSTVMFITAYGFAVPSSLADLTNTQEDQKKLTQLRVDGQTFLKEGSYEQAAKAFAEACSLRDSDLPSHGGYAIALLELGKTDEAIDHLLRVTSSAGASSSAWETLACAYQENGQTDNALKALQHALTINPTAQQYRRINDLIEQMKTAMSLKQSSTADYFEEATQKRIRWAKMPIKVYVEPGTALPNFKESYMVFLKQAFVDWAGATGDKISIDYVPDKSAADIYVHWTNNPNEIPHPSEAGNCNISYREGAFKGTIIILLSLGRDFTKLSDRSIENTIYHEVGHSLGLLGHSPDPKDIMYFYGMKNPASNKLSARDRRTIERLYTEDIGPSALAINTEGLKLAVAGNEEAGVAKFKAALAIDPSLESAVYNLLKAEALLSLKLIQRQDFKQAKVYTDALLNDAEKYHYSKIDEIVPVDEDLLRRLHEDKEAEKLRAKYANAFPKH